MSFHVALNNVSTTVAVARNSGATSLTVADGSVFGSTFPVYITAVRSGSVVTILEITARSGNVLTVTGGVDGSTDAALQAGDVVECRDNAGLFNEKAADASVVHLTGDETIGGTKTFTSPIDGTLTGSRSNDDPPIDVLKITTTDADGMLSAGIQVGSVKFGDVVDPVITMGYNIGVYGPIDPDEPAWGWFLEGDYWEEASGKRLCEAYLGFWPAGSSGASIRPIFLRMNRTASDPTLALDAALYFGNPISFVHPDGTPFGTLALAGSSLAGSVTTNFFSTGGDNAAYLLTRRDTHALAWTIVSPAGQFWIINEGRSTIPLIIDASTDAVTFAGPISAPNLVRRYAATIGDGSSSSLVVTHALGTKDVEVTFRLAADDSAVLADWTATSTAAITASFADPPAPDSIRVTILA